MCHFCYSTYGMLSELNHSTWFNYELFQFILKVKDNEDEVFLMTCVDELFFPYLKHSVFEGKDILRHNQHHLQHASSPNKVLVSKNLYEVAMNQ